MSPKKRNQKLLGYVRVSRSKEEGISPDLQRAAVEAYAFAHGHEVEWLSPDLDESGKSLDRPAMQEALALLASGKYDGIIAARLDRLTRKVGDLGKLLDLAQEQDWNLIAIDLGVDLTTANGRMVANILGTLAEWELDRRREGWMEAQKSAVERGRPNARTPFGYLRENGRLVPDPVTGPVVTELFARRAKGETYPSLADWLEAGSVPKPHSETPWLATNVKKILANTKYLGQTRYGSLLNAESHESLVDEETWWRVRAGTLSSAAPTNRGEHPLSGFVFCAGCGMRMRRATYKRKSGLTHHYWRCQYDRCPSKSFIPALAFDPLVYRQIAAGALVQMQAPKKASERLDAARAAVEEAEARLETFERTWVERGLNPEDAISMRKPLVEARDAAVARLTELPADESGLAAVLAHAAESGIEVDGEIVESKLGSPWTEREILAVLSIEGEPDIARRMLNVTRKEIMRRTLKAITVSGKKGPAEERVTVELL